MANIACGVFECSSSLREVCFEIQTNFKSSNNRLCGPVCIPKYRGGGNPDFVLENRHVPLSADCAVCGNRNFNRLAAEQLHLDKKKIA